MKIKAKFKGSNSLGYENGENYHLYFKLDTNGCQDVISITQIETEITPGHWRIRKGSYCEYQSLKAFLNNWQVF